MIQKFMDGKKKYTALVLTLIAALIPVFIPQPDAQSQLMELAPSVAAVIAGIFYIITQGKLDEEKEKTKQANGTTATTTAAGLAAAAAAPASQAAAPAIQLAPPEPETEFDVKDFHQTVLDTVKAKYTEVNQATIFYRARDIGNTTVCQSSKQARQYWDYLVSLAYDADAWFKEMDAKTKGQCGRSVNYAIWQQDFSTILNQQAWLTELLNSGIDWKTKLTPTNCTLLHVGAQAREMLHPEYVSTRKI